MANGWQTLGAVLGGGVDRQGAFMQGQMQSAKTLAAVENARLTRSNAAIKEDEASQRMLLGDALRKLGYSPDEAEAYASIGRGGFGNFEQLTSGRLNMQEYGNRQTLADELAPASQRQAASDAVEGKFRAFLPVGSHGFYDTTNIEAGVQQPTDSLGNALTQNLPASIQEWNIFSQMTPDQQRRYLQMKRAAPTFKMGDVTMLGDPITETARPFAEQPGETQADVQHTISEQEAEGVAMQENVKAATKLADESFRRLEGVKANIANYDEAIRLIDEGAQTGVIASRLPSVRQASIALDNLQGRLGLDVIGNTTFGALSEAELKFALNTALPQNMQPQALKVWLQQKRDAQEKLAAYLEQASIFLGTPGNTVKDWIELQRSKGGAQPLGDALTGPSEPQTPPPTNARGWRLMSDASGNMAYVSPDGSQFEEVH